MEPLTLYVDNLNPRSGVAKFQRSINILMGLVFITNGALHIDEEGVFAILYIIIGLIALVNGILLPQFYMSLFISIDDNGIKVKDSYLKEPSLVSWNSITAISSGPLTLKIAKQDGQTQEIALGKFTFEQKKSLKSRLREYSNLNQIEVSL